MTQQDLMEELSIKMSCTYCGATPDNKCRDLDGQLRGPHMARTGVILDAFAAGYMRGLDERVDVQ